MTTGSGTLTATPVEVGHVLAGKYQVERVLGSGGMGVVVAAKHVHLGERVAIKFLLPNAIKKAEVVQRFEREARAAARIKSEHVARVFDVGRLEDGAPYMVMEFLEGSDLSTILKAKGAVPIEAAVEYVLQACEAIAEAHALGIIHRDLKPANLFVTHRADGSPVVKVIDFGISKVADPTSEGDVEMTKTDVMMGSPVYMAPEQMISARDVDPRADVWSLGVILYYLIMGAQPFRGGSVTQLYAAILEGPPTMRDTRPDVPEALEAATIKCLQANPKDRHGNIAELATAIAQYAPAHARISADRVSRTLGISPSNGLTVPIAPSAAQSITPPSAISSEASIPGVGKASDQAAPSTDGSWGGTRGPTARGSKRTVLYAVGTIALAVTVGVVVWFARDHVAQPNEIPTAANPPAATQPPTVVTPAPIATDAPTSTTTSSAPRTATTSAPTASASVATEVPRVPTRVVGPGPVPKTTGTATKTADWSGQK